MANIFNQPLSPSLYRRFTVVGLVRKLKELSFEACLTKCMSRKPSVAFTKWIENMACSLACLAGLYK